MGNDAPLACLSQFQPLIYEYFKQLFAQVTNPPIDPFRERVVMSLACPIGPEQNILEPSAKQCHRIFLQHPILSLDDLEVLRENTHRGWKTYYSIKSGENEDRYLNQEPENNRRSAIKQVASGRFGVTSSYLAHADDLQIKMAQGAKPGEGGELPGYKNYSAAMERGIAKVMAKMGISTLQSYKGAQIFEAVGLSEEVIHRCFRGTPSRIGGVTFEMIAQDSYERHMLAYAEHHKDMLVLRNPGFFHWRAGGERHINEPLGIANLQEAAVNKSKNAYDKFRESTMNSLRACTLRGQLDIVSSDKPVDLSEVEPASEIVKRFATGAMSFGSISLEAHQTLAIAMNRIGGKSNTGEGGMNNNFWIYLRNGLRPSRFYVMKDNIMVMASEVGVYDTAPDNVILKSRLKPGRMLLVDTKEKTIIQDVELKLHIARSRPHQEWLKEEVRMEENIFIKIN
ncbi:hypothetical protein J437_LFUL018601 [Ladona fulva]|uniref:Glutamate synthase n=1 Tax=Ladona fulva TaxID=123851 RepID=A0A8K0KR27_LADFU|nr:hypothetical protein J437_LFUL018601 [Ladona fulva]